MDRSVQFRRWKTQCLSKADLSRKGSVDEDVVELIQFLNARDQFFTTSSCSGRILLLDGGINGFEVQKQNCCWLLVTHKSCVKDDVILALKKASADTILKFEPFVLHVQCRQLKDAQILHTVAIDSGFRNSGITVGKRGKTILAVRSTHSLEVPLSHKGKLMVTEEYIDFLVNVANQKMEENKRRIESGLRTTPTVLSWDCPHQKDQPCDYEVGSLSQDLGKEGRLEIEFSHVDIDSTNHADIMKLHMNCEHLKLA
ncbi:tRNA wybutosine-synthesizing protein 3 homolog isoform X2 [Tamandua tetradactyla]|uniref:tRNA wybutosine-synthesizing protein 3 homolog isoform X2 n=1 Tax=Tamandua tetradactyla TaxID=48850 RepID=UPI00405421C4